MTGLFGSAILEVALGLFLLYLLLSIICSSVQEMVAALLKLRSRDLVMGIANLVCDPAMFTAVMKHPAIVAFGNTDAEHSLVRLFSRREAGLPSYISARAFTLALLDGVAPVRQMPSTIQAVREQAVALIQTAERETTALVSALPNAAPLAQPTAILEQVRASIEAQFAAVPASSEKGTVSDLLQAGQIDEAVRAALKLAATHPVRVAVVVAIEQNLGRELYQWALPLPEGDALRRTIVGSVEGKQRLGLFLLNIIDRQVQGESNGQVLSQMSTLLKELPDDTGRQAVEKTLASGAPLAQLRAEAEANLPPFAARRVLGIIDGAQTEFGRLSTAIEGWYDESMQHVSGVYKRRIKTYIFFIALVLSLVSGADSLRFVGTLYASPALRDVLVREAEAVVSGTPTPVPAGGQPGAGAAEPRVSASFQNAQEAAQQLSQFSQLFGFDDHPPSAPLPPTADTAAWGLFLLKRVFGSVITAFAVSLGAPFWFDVLQKVVNMRSTGTRTSTAPAESK
jgi:hypothetical protein